MVDRDPSMPGDCILFATADWDAPYWTNKQHVASHLAEKGYRVLYVESVGLRAPSLRSGLDLSRLWRRLWRGLRGIRKQRRNLWVLSPLVLPFAHGHLVIQRLNMASLSRAIRRFSRRHGFARPMIWTYLPYMLEAIAGLAHGPLVYHCVDDLGAVPGVDAAAFDVQEHRLLAAADVVFTTGRALEKKCAVHNPNVHFFPNVADHEHFSKALEPLPLPEDLAAIPEPRLCYVGVLSDFKVDFDLLWKVATQRPDWQLVLIGEEREGQASNKVARLRKLPNVHFLGYRPYAVLPDYLRGMSVGLLPSLINDYTRSMFPMKYFEYLAAGLPVVSTPLEFTRGSSVGMEVTQAPEAFASAIERQLFRGRLTVADATSMVGSNTWATRTERMLKLVDSTNSQ